MAVKPIPEGYHSINTYLIVKGAPKAIEFYKAAFGASERMRMPMPDGRIGHAELQIGDSVLMLADEFPEMGHKSPLTLGGAPVGMSLYVPDCDAVFNAAVKAGAKVERPLENQFYGDRAGTLVDPFGHKWTVMTHVEDVSPEEMQKRMAKMNQK